MRNFLVLSIILLLSVNSYSQNPLVKQWDKRYGCSGLDILKVILETNDNGLLLSGFSSSDTCPAKSQPSWGSGDYWIIKTDSLGNKQWDKRFGGIEEDLLYSVIQTNDGGYVLGGSTLSDSSGDVSEHTRDTIAFFNSEKKDYWIVKIDSTGNKQWDKRFGGKKEEILFSLQQTNDGGYILGGTSSSDSSGDKTQDAWGWEDYWIIKTDSSGTKEWDKRFGGSYSEQFKVIKQTTDNGFLLGGSSFISDGDVTQPTFGSYDYWIIKIDSLGNKTWDKRFGGGDYDALASLDFTDDNNYILFGVSNSGIGGNKTQALKDTSNLPFSNYHGDFWIVKIDTNGSIMWDQDIGGFMAEEATGNIMLTSDGGFLFGGDSYSNMGADKTEDNYGTERAWMVKTDSLGIIDWDKTIFTVAMGDDEDCFVLETIDGCIVLGSHTASGIGGYVSVLNQDSLNRGYWIVKFCDSTLATSYIDLHHQSMIFNVSPNPFINKISVQGLQSPAEIILYDVFGRKVLSQSHPTLNTTHLPKGIYFLEVVTEKGRMVKKVVKG